MQNKKLQVWLPLIFSIVLIAGMYLGYKLNERSGIKTGFFAPDKRRPLQEALDLIKLKYVDSVHIDSLEANAIQDLMSGLDPHSVYFPPVEVSGVNQDLAGEIEGIGIEFSVFNDTVNVVYVVPDGPSDKAGLQMGDKVLKVNDSVITGKSLTNADIISLIRGQKATKANLSVLRGKEQKVFIVTRGTFPVSSIDAAYMIDKTHGYIKLNKFTQTSYPDFMKSLEELQKQGLKDLILDLRGNGGGFMNEAVEIADEFLEGDKLIVYTQGVNNPKREYRCKRQGIFEKGKLSVLVDELSASASEVLAGALQDWCRAKIIGRRTFGKGLVQEQYDLSDGSAIRLTVARYYTPLGRSIQRPYEKGKKVYMDELWERYSNGELLSADSNKVNHGKIFLTPCQDTVYGGGAIMPNIFVPLDTSRYQLNVNALLLNSNFNSFIYNYYLQHRSQLDHFSSAAEYIKGFADTDKMWNEFVAYANNDSVNLKTIPEVEKAPLQRRLKAFLARFKWRSSGLYEVLNSDDRVIRKVLEVMGN